MKGQDSSIGDDHEKQEQSILRCWNPISKPEVNSNEKTRPLFPRMCSKALQGVPENLDGLKPYTDYFFLCMHTSDDV